MKKTLLLPLILTSATLVAPTLARAKNSFYVGVDSAYAAISRNSEAKKMTNNTNLGYGIAFGVTRLIKPKLSLGAEIGYHELGSLSFNDYGRKALTDNVNQISPLLDQLWILLPEVQQLKSQMDAELANLTKAVNDYKYKTNAFDLLGVGQYQLNPQLFLVGKIGVAYLKADIKAQGIPVDPKNEIQPEIRLGMRYQFTQHLGLHAEGFYINGTKENISISNGTDNPVSSSQEFDNIMTGTAQEALSIKPMPVYGAMVGFNYTF